MRSREDATVLDPLLVAMQASLDALIASVLATLKAEPAIGPAIGPARTGAEPADFSQGVLNELEAALAASDVQAHHILASSGEALRGELGNAYEPLRRQIADYLFPQALATLRRARGARRA
jgi:hypothetical protein